jgi:hypothetical protein
MIRAARTFARFSRGLGPFLRTPRTLEESRAALRRQVAAREESFLRMVEDGILRSPGNPYRRLLDHAGVELGDLRAMVRDDGVEGALERLYAAGVYLRVAEARGRERVRRGSLELSCTIDDFENPLTVEHFEARSGGSRTAGTRVAIDFDTISNEAAYHAIFRDAFGISDQPIAVWYPVPPGIAGIKIVLNDSKLGAPPERWFSQTPLDWSPRGARHALFTVYAVRASRRHGVPIPMPEHTAAADGARVARWLADKRAAGTPGVLQATPSSAVRACQAARDAGLDLSGTFFRSGGEPYTAGKQAAIEAAGCRAACNYYMAEVGGQIGIACANPEVPGEVHIVSDRLAVLQRPSQVGPGTTVDALVFTTISPASVKLVLNLQGDDYATRTERRCGCPVEEVGFLSHLHTIRSQEKLTSEGMNFVGNDLLVLLEEELPRRFGGAPTDYQLVEEEHEGVSKVHLVVSPDVGALDDAEVADAALRFLSGRGDAQHMMAEVWRDATTLEVVRRRPEMTRASKLMPLHLPRR